MLVVVVVDVDIDVVATTTTTTTTTATTTNHHGSDEVGQERDTPTHTCAPSTSTLGASSTSSRTSRQVLLQEEREQKEEK